MQWIEIWRFLLLQVHSPLNTLKYRHILDIYHSSNDEESFKARISLHVKSEKVLLEKKAALAHEHQRLVDDLERKKAKLHLLKERVRILQKNSRASKLSKFEAVAKICLLDSFSSVLNDEKESLIEKHFDLWLLRTSQAGSKILPQLEKFIVNDFNLVKNNKISTDFIEELNIKVFIEHLKESLDSKLTLMQQENQDFDTKTVLDLLKYTIFLC